MDHLFAVAPVNFRINVHLEAVWVFGPDHLVEPSRELCVCVMSQVQYNLIALYKVNHSLPLLLSPTLLARSLNKGTLHTCILVSLSFDTFHPITKYSQVSNFMDD